MKHALLIIDPIFLGSVTSSNAAKVIHFLFSFDFKYSLIFASSNVQLLLLTLDVDICSFEHKRSNSFLVLYKILTFFK